MNKASIITGLIFLLVVSIAIAGVYASEVNEISHDDSTDNADGLYISGSGDVCHVSSNYKPLSEISTLELWNYILRWFD